MPLYRILPGHSFQQHDGTVLTGGQTIELNPDVAADHRHRVELLPDAPAPEVPAGPDSPETGDA